MFNAGLCGRILTEIRQRVYQRIGIGMMQFLAPVRGPVSTIWPQYITLIVSAKLAIAFKSLLISKMVVVNHSFYPANVKLCTCVVVPWR